MELKQKIHILTGEGIECEKESFEFFKKLSFEGAVEYLPLYQFLDHYERFFEKTRPGDWILLPGGFSFADHFGAGRLLAYRLKEIDFFKKIVERSLHCMGICNGFQVLVESGVFGENTKLLGNRKKGVEKNFHFTNKWVQLKSPLVEKALELPVRHGEGRFEGQENELRDLKVEPFLKYEEDSFDNGSLWNVAGVYRKMSGSTFWGMMPHPEIVATRVNHPNTLGPERMLRFRESFLSDQGDGLFLVQAILKKAACGEELK